jgi:hypothetical protein
MLGAEAGRQRVRQRFQLHSTVIKLARWWKLSFCVIKHHEAKTARVLNLSTRWRWWATRPGRPLLTLVPVLMLWRREHLLSFPGIESRFLGWSLYRLRNPGYLWRSYQGQYPPHLCVSVFFLGGGVRLSAFGASATTWPIAPTPDDRWWWVEQSVEWELEGETEVLGENFSQCHLVHDKFHITWPGLETGPPRWESDD